MVLIKQGVCGAYSRPIAWALGQIHKLCQEEGLDVLITSIGEANHGAGSLHFLQPSDAIDWRPIFVVDHKNIEPEIAIPDPRWITKSLVEGTLSGGRFANQFDVVDGYDDGHFHVECDPREGG